VSADTTATEALLSSTPLFDVGEQPATPATPTTVAAAPSPRNALREMMLLSFIFLLFSIRILPYRAFPQLYGAQCFLRYHPAAMKVRTIYLEASPQSSDFEKCHVRPCDQTDKPIDLSCILSCIKGGISVGYRNVATIRTPAVYLGSCFFLAWINGAFFTSALHSFSDSDQGFSLISSYWDASVIGVFLGLTLFALLEKLTGEICLRTHFLLISTLLICVGTLLMVFDAVFSDTTWVWIGYVGALATGIFSAPFYIAWSQAYSNLSAERAEIIIPLAVALAQLFSVIFTGLTGWLATVCLLTAPLLSMSCLLICLNEEKNTQENVAGSFDAEKLSVTTCNSADKDHYSALLNWRNGIFFAVLWIALSLMTALTRTQRSDTFADNYLLPFSISFVALLILMVLHINYSRRLSMVEAVRILVPLMLISLISLLVLPENSVVIAFLLARTSLMFFWALLWIFCTRVIRDGQASATRTVGTVRGWIQFGAALAIPIMLFLPSFGLVSMVCFCMVLFAVAFSIALPTIIAASEPVTALTAAETDNNLLAMSFASRCDTLAERFKLSPREREMLELLIRGRNLPYIRETLYISRNTINTHIRHIYSKMNIHSRLELNSIFDTIEVEKNHSHL
jgi:DNA-binding CsgD family transcriptional regulator